MKTEKTMRETEFGARRMLDQSRKVHRDARSLERSVEVLFTDAESALRQNLAESPYATLGIAAGIGFVVAGGLGGRLAIGLAAITGRALVSVALQSAVVGVLGSHEPKQMPEEMMEDA